jgi:hypothetical protein
MALCPDLGSGQDLDMLQNKIEEQHAKLLAFRSRTGTGGEGVSSGQQRPAALRSRTGTGGEGGSSGQQRPPAATLPPTVPKSQEGGKKKSRKKCPHDRQRSLCRDCGGGSICQHSKHRDTCKACGGTSICEHGRVRSCSEQTQWGKGQSSNEETQWGKGQSGSEQTQWGKGQSGNEETQWGKGQSGNEETQWGKGQSGSEQTQWKAGESGSKATQWVSCGRFGVKGNAETYASMTALAKAIGRPSRECMSKALRCVKKKTPSSALCVDFKCAGLELFWDKESGVGESAVEEEKEEVAP